MSTTGTTTTTKAKKKIINAKFIILFIFIIIGSYFGYRYISSKNQVENQIQQRTTAVTRGDLKVSISGSGTLESGSTLTALSSVEGTISKIHFQDGDKVEAGSLIMELDSGEALLDIKKLENNIKKSKLSRDQLMESLESNQVIAPISGEIANIRYESGDKIGEGSSLLTITDKSKLKVLLPFRNSYINELELGQKATVYVFDNSLDEVYEMEGFISFISSNPESEEEYEAYNVEFIIDNPGYLDDTMIASAEITLSDKTLKSIGNSNLSYVDTAEAKAELAGTIEELNVVSGQYVKKGDILASISNDDLSIELETTNLSIEEMETQLEYQYEQLSHYKMYSDIEGILSLEDLKEGDAVKSGQSVFSVTNYDLMEFNIPIDELDISKIKTNQEVNITVDALEETNNKPLSGIVTEIAREGNSSNGVTTYPVTIQLTETNDQLKVGMNVNGEIIINEKTDVLYVPIEAVQKRGNNTIVFVKSGETNEQETSQDQDIKDRTKTQDNSYYAGAEARTVEIGINNDEYIEITDGLKEGEIVILPPTVSSTDSEDNQMRTNFGTGMPGGMPGGMQQRSQPRRER